SNASSSQGWNKETKGKYIIIMNILDLKLNPPKVHEGRGLLSAISSNEQDDEKDTIKSNCLEQSNKEVLDMDEILHEEESEDNVNSLPTQIDKWVPKDCPLYKHLLISRNSSFHYLNPIGKGGFGSVVKARHILDNNIYAIKKIKLHLGT